MVATTENQLIHREDGNKGGGPVEADAIIYTGTLVYVGAASGCYNGTAAGKFAGIAIDYADNTGGADGDITIDIWERSSFVLQGAGFAQDDVGKPAYGSDNNTVAVSGTVVIGTITRVISATQVLVALDVHAA